jgi:hypothetical protein
MTAADLGFHHRLRKSGDVEIHRHGSLVTLLRGKSAYEFKRDVETCTPAEAQQLMARLTGNYKRGNERTARGHPRNRA